MLENNTQAICTWLANFEQNRIIKVPTDLDYKRHTYMLIVHNDLIGWLHTPDEIETDSEVQIVNRGKISKNWNTKAY